MNAADGYAITLSASILKVFIKDGVKDFIIR